MAANKGMVRNKNFDLLKNHEKTAPNTPRKHGTRKGKDTLTVAAGKTPIQQGIRSYMAIPDENFGARYAEMFTRRPRRSY
jgi:hypothetical protein